MSYTIEDQADVVRHIIDIGWNIGVFSPKPNIKKYDDLYTVTPVDNTTNFIRTLFVSQNFDSNDLNYNYETTEHYVSVILDAATRARIIALRNHCLTVLKTVRKQPIAADNTYDLLRVIRVIPNINEKINQYRFTIDVILDSILDALP